MVIPPEDGLDSLPAQQALADRLLRLGTALQQQSVADPALVLETAIAALAVTRVELTEELVQRALEEAPPSQVAWWERELGDDQVYVADLLALVQRLVNAPRGQPYCMASPNVGT